jgi:hypothetical protein
METSTEKEVDEVEEVWELEDATERVAGQASLEADGRS